MTAKSLTNVILASLKEGKNVTWHILSQDFVCEPIWKKLEHCSVDITLALTRELAFNLMESLLSICTVLLEICGTYNLVRQKENNLWNILAEILCSYTKSVTFACKLSEVKKFLQMFLNPGDVSVAYWVTQLGMQQIMTEITLLNILSCTTVGSLN